MMSSWQRIARFLFVALALETLLLLYSLLRFSGVTLADIGSRSLDKAALPVTSKGEYRRHFNASYELRSMLWDGDSTRSLWEKRIMTDVGKMLESSRSNGDWMNEGAKDGLAERLLADYRSTLREFQSWIRQMGRFLDGTNNANEFKTFDSITERPLNPLERYYASVRTGNGRAAASILNESIVNAHDFRYLINPGWRTCRDDSVFLFAFVPTAVGHYEYRKSVRRTWASARNHYVLPVRHLFFLGRPEVGHRSENLQRLLESEAALFHDIVQADFVDTYSNLTFKTLTGIRWMATFCRQAKYVLKIDDDTFVNMIALLRVLELHDRIKVKVKDEVKAKAKVETETEVTTEMTIFGRVVLNDEVHRTGKWMVTERQFRYDSFPTYCSGPAYVLSGPTALALHNCSAHVPFFFLEDVYLTGMVPLLLEPSVRHLQWQDRYVSSDQFPGAFLRIERDYYLFAIQVDDSQLYLNAWKQMKRLRSRTNSSVEKLTRRPFLSHISNN